MKRLSMKKLKKSDTEMPICIPEKATPIVLYIFRSCGNPIENFFTENKRISTISQTKKQELYNTFITYCPERYKYFHGIKNDNEVTDSDRELVINYHSNIIFSQYDSTELTVFLAEALNDPVVNENFNEFLFTSSRTTLFVS